ncbi:MAG: nucleoside 2-deoxyribosyltransferase, partial [archaeon]
GVGYEIGRAVENKKPVLCLFRPAPGKRVSPMINGSDYIINDDYQTIAEAKKIIDDFFKTILA